MSDEELQPPIGLDVEAHNAWIEELKADVEWEPLRGFLDLLKEPQQ